MKVREICHSITDGSHNPPQGVEESKYLMLSSKNIFDDEITVDDPRFLTEEAFQQEDKRTRIAPGDVLLTIVGTVGRTAVVSHDMPRFTLQRSVAVLHPKRDVCLSRFLMYALRSKRAYIEKTAKGVAQKGIYLGEVGEIDLPIPTKEQQESVIDTLDKVCLLIQTRQRQLRTLDTLIKARFVEMFGDPIKNTKSWKTIPLVEACERIFGGGTPSKSHLEYFDGDIPWVSPKDMKTDVITDSIDHITEEAIANSTTNLVPKGSILMVIRSGILKHSLPVAINAIPVTINQDMKAFLPGKKITASFLSNYFKAIETDVLSRVRGVTADNIDFKAFQQRNIILPPLDLQIAFEAFCREADKSKVVVQQALEKAQLLFDSLMQKYFG